MVWVATLSVCAGKRNKLEQTTAAVNKPLLVRQLSPVLFLPIFSALQGLVSAFERLFQHMQLLVEFGQLLALAANLANRVQYSCVVTATEKLSYFRKTFLRQFFCQVHGYLAWSRDTCRPLLGVHVGDFDFVIVGNGFLNVLDGDLPVLN